MQIKDMKIGARLGLAFSAVLALTIGLAFIGNLRLQQVGAAADDMDIAIRKLRLADNWLAASRTNRALSEARLRAADKQDLDMLGDRMKANSAGIAKTREELGKLVVLAEGKAMLAQIDGQRKAYSAIRDQVFAAKQDGAETAVVNRLIEQQMNPALASYENSVAQLGERQQRLFVEAQQRVNALTEDGQRMLLLFGVLAVILGGALAWRLTVGITRPLRQAVDLADAVAGGDLSARVDVASRDETGELMSALKRMTDNLNSLVLQVRAGTDTIGTASTQIAAGNQDLSSRTEQQASSLEETAASMEELTSAVRQNADNARQANSMAQAASGVADRGGEVIRQVVDTMSGINDASRRIAEIIGTIDGIAFQTNILALNAAVEAARAGEQGRGFAVVASEVRTLAQRSATAAKEIKLLIEDSVQRVDAGGRLVAQAGSTMQELHASVQRVTDIMGEITSASVEQTAGIEQVNVAVTQMDQVTQQNAALVEEAAAAAEAMQEQARGLAEAVSVFRLAKEGAQVTARRALALH
jgi:methyl-accepting chemotaxis protein